MAGVARKRSPTMALRKPICKKRLPKPARKKINLLALVDDLLSSPSDPLPADRSPLTISPASPSFSETSAHACSTINSPPTSTANHAPPTKMSVDLLPENEFIEGIFTSIYKMMSAYGSEPELPEPGHPSKIFYAASEHDFGLFRYIKRLIINMKCSRSAFIIGLIYVDRIGKVDKKTLGVNELNVYRLISIAFILGAKWLEDEIWEFEYYRRVAAIPDMKDLIQSEKIFLERSKWRLSVEEQEFANMEDKVLVNAEALMEYPLE